MPAEECMLRISRNSSREGSGMMVGTRFATIDFLLQVAQSSADCVLQPLQPQVLVAGLLPFDISKVQTQGRHRQEFFGRRRRDNW